MDIHNTFKLISEQLLIDFRKAAEINHSGGKGAFREDSFRNFLGDYLPIRYAVGKGEIISPQNIVSPEMDVVIYDPYNCPILLKAKSHSVYPIESIFGAISMKSNLDSAELMDAYKNIVAFKRIIPRSSFVYRPNPAMSIGLSFPMPVTGIVAYSANRSLESIASQLREIDRDCDDLMLRPDFVAVIGQGIIAPRAPLRGEFNAYKLPDKIEIITELRKTGSHTLFRLYLQILRELNALTLRPLELTAYDDMPRIIGQHRVSSINRFVIFKLDDPSKKFACRLNQFGVIEIINGSKRVSLRRHLENFLGEVPDYVVQQKLDLDQELFEFNPGNKPPVSFEAYEAGSQFFQPVDLHIDGNLYKVDLSSLDQRHYDIDVDFTVDELLSR